MKLYQASFQHELSARDCRKLLPKRQHQIFCEEENAKLWIRSQVKRLEKIILMLNRECPDIWPENRITHENHERLIRYVVASCNPYKRNTLKQMRCRATSQIKQLQTAD